jgi:hypothetical protein
MTDVLAVDLDDTVVDATDRVAAALRDIGVEPGSDPSATVDSLPGKQKTAFFQIFQSEKYTDMDKPNIRVIAKIREVAKETGLPAVIVTGRLDSMMDSVNKAAGMLGIPVKDVIVRKESERKRKTSEYKVSEMKARGYRPVHVFDDDEGNLAAFAAEWPDIKLHHVKGGTVSEMRRLEVLLGELRTWVLA